MSFTITGLPAKEFTPLFSLWEGELNRRSVIRKVADTTPGYPCRITLENAANEIKLPFNNDDIA